LEAARAAFEPLRALGYRYHEHRPEAHAFSKPESGADWWEQTHHLHLTEPGSDLWRERLAFRDALRADPALAAEYQEWKLSHAATAAHPNAYTAGKRAFVARVLADKGIELKPDSERLTPAALEARRGYRFLESGSPTSEGGPVRLLLPMRRTAPALSRAHR
jgi:hypothetical protein